MIKVNLLKNRGSGRGGAAKTDVADTQFEEAFDSAFEDEKKGGNGKKIFFMLIGCVSLYFYEMYNIDQLTSANSAVNAQVQQLDQEIGSIKPKIESAKKLQNENEELNKKLKLVKDLGRLRLREIRAIDHIQNILPEKVWLTTMKFTETTFDVVGFSANDQELDRLLDGIRQHPTFVDVLLARSVDQKTAQGNVKSFNITSSLSKDY
jgi:Tfp pilus assembly protein PilN